MKKNFWADLAFVLCALLVIAGTFFVRDVSGVLNPTVQEVSLAEAKDGSYVGTAKGFGGTVQAIVTLKGGKIESVKLSGPDETAQLGGVALPKLEGRFVNAQSTDVKLVSGATVSSTAAQTAVAAALAKAGVDASKLIAIEDSSSVVRQDVTRDVDVVVVGAGGAGMSAAIKATQAGMKVLVLEKMPYVGGNTTKASGGMNAAGTKVQEASAAAETDEKVKAAIEDSTVENFIADTIRSGHDINNVDLVTKMAEESSDAVEWLASLGAELTKLAATGSTVHYYLHEPADGSAVGGFLVEQFSRVIEEMDIEVLLETEATELLHDGSAVTGVKAVSEEYNYTVNAKAVVLATGGFGANFEMMSSYDPSLANAVTTNTPAATGDGIKMATAVGADTVDMEYIQLHPTVFQDNGFLVSERLRSNGAILINADGNRFVNDLAGRDTVSQAELKQPGAYSYIVYDSKYTEESLYKKYVNNGLTVSADTVEELAETLGYTGEAYENFIKTVADWNEVCAGNKEDDWGRNNGLISLDVGPYTAIKIAPGIHHTMGGLKINTETEVIDTEGNVIAGLFAAGEVTGGVHGGNRVGGNAVADIVVFGRIAGTNAAEYAANH